MWRNQIVFKHLRILFFYIILYIIGYITVPIGISIAKKVSLPKLFWWWDNQHDTRFGNQKWKDKWGGKVFKFWPQFLWLHIRNPLHNYCADNGVEELPEKPYYKLIGNYYIGYRTKKYDNPPGVDIYGWRGIFKKR